MYKSSVILGNKIVVSVSRLTCFQFNYKNSLLINNFDENKEDKSTKDSNMIFLR